MLAHINVIRKLLVFFGVNHGESVDGYEDFVAITMNSYGIIEILVFRAWGSKLYIYVFGDTRRYHAFLIVFNLEVRCAWG